MNILISAVSAIAVTSYFINFITFCSNDFDDYFIEIFIKRVF